MSKSAQTFFLKWGDWIHRGAILLGLLAILWLNGRYVTRQEFQNYIELNSKATKEFNERLDSRLSDLNEKFILIKENTARIDQKLQLDRTTVVVQDHEGRIRDLEKKK